VHTIKYSSDDLLIKKTLYKFSSKIDLSIGVEPVGTPESSFPNLYCFTGRNERLYKSLSNRTRNGLNTNNHNNATSARNKHSLRSFIKHAPP
jgi:hypothetical protein